MVRWGRLVPPLAVPLDRLVPPLAPSAPLDRLVPPLAPSAPLVALVGEDEVGEDEVGDDDGRRSRKSRVGCRVVRMFHGTCGKSSFEAKDTRRKDST